MIEASVIEEVEAHGGKLRVVGGELQLLAARLPDDLMTMLRLHRAKITRYIDPTIEEPRRLPPLPKSVRACLAYFGRHPNKDLTPKLQAWLEKDWERITRYERIMQR